MKIQKILSSFALAALLAGGITALAPGNAAIANAGVSVETASSSTEGFTVLGSDGAYRSVVPNNESSAAHAGLSATIHMQDTDRISLGDDARSFFLQDHTGTVLFNSVNPTLGQGETSVPAKFVVEGNNLMIVPVDETPVFGTFSKCASSFWGNLIFNIGMSGVCAMLGIATAGAGGVACTMALIGANLGIDWDKPC
ncbi:hypothetical protein [Mycetocola saprophilus]|uniref:hypothetical protein n=1 Tax=Mycetocola saprophilus TaxID=76636 RepID=UPI003BF25EC1